MGRLTTRGPQPPRSSLGQVVCIIAVAIRRPLIGTDIGQRCSIYLPSAISSGSPAPCYQKARILPAARTGKMTGSIGVRRTDFRGYLYGKRAEGGVPLMIISGGAVFKILEHLRM